MNKKWQAPFRRMLALLLCIASLLGMFPALTLVTKAADGDITASGYLDRDSGVVRKVLTDMKNVKYVPITSHTATIKRGAALIVASQKYSSNFIMSYDPASGAPQATTGSITQNSNGKSEGTYYIDADDNIIMDQSLRNNAIWIFGQMTSATDENLSSGNLFGQATSSIGDTSNVHLNYYRPFGGKEFHGIHMQKGYSTVTSYNSNMSKSFWYNDGVTSNLLNRHLFLRRTSNDNFIFGNDSELTTNFENTHASRSEMSLRDNSGIASIYHRFGQTDLRVLHCDSNGVWSSKQYKTNNRTDSDLKTRYNEELRATAELAAADNGIFLRLYQYVEEDSYKYVAYKGYTQYNVANGTSITEIINKIADQIVVFDPVHKDQEIPFESRGDQVQSKEGYYRLELPANFDSKVSGTYTVNIYYNDPGDDTLIGTVTLKVDDLSDEVLISRDVYGTGNGTTTSSSQISFAPYNYDSTIYTGSKLIIKNEYWDYVMSYSPDVGASADTGSIVPDQLGQTMSTYYDDGTKIYMDQSLRNDAMWIIRQMVKYDTSKNKNVADITNEAANDTKNTAMGYITYNSSNQASISDRTPRFRGKLIYGVHLQKGRTTYQEDSYWYNNGTDSNLWRHLVFKVDSNPFNNTTFWNDQLSNNSTHIKTSFVIEMLSSGYCVIYYQAGNHDLRVLHCDKDGKWSVKQYYTEYDTDKGGIGWDPAVAETTRKVYADPGNFHRIYGYSTSGSKQISYKGYTEYAVKKGATQAEILDVISKSLTVYDPGHNNQQVPYGATSGKVGQYTLAFHSFSGTNNNGFTSFQNNTAGKYQVDIKYVGDSGTVNIGSVIVYVDDLNASNVFTAVDKMAVITRTNAGNTPLYAVKTDDKGNVVTDEFGNAVAKTTATGAGVSPTLTYRGVTGTLLTNPITLDMLYRPVTDIYGQTEYEPLDYTTYATPGTYTGLKLVYHGVDVCTDFTLYVVGHTLELDQAVYPNPGSVEVGKGNIGQETHTPNDVKTNIELSAKAESTTRGVDLIIMMDLSNSMLEIAETVNGVKKSRLQVMKESIQKLLEDIDTQEKDVRIAIADFGDLDLYEFKDSVIDKKYSAWPHLEIGGGEQSGGYANYDGKGYINNRTYETFNHLNFVLGPDDYGYTYNGTTYNYGSLPFWTIQPKYDMGAVGKLTDATNDILNGKLQPCIYTGATGQKVVGASAFVESSVIYEGIAQLFADIEHRAQMALGTNYDVGLEYAYRLAYARQQANKAAKLDRNISLIFMSDGAAMQYNYFSGRTQIESWNKWLKGETDSVLTTHETSYEWDFKYEDEARKDYTLTNFGKLHPNLQQLMEKIHKELAAQHGKTHNRIAIPTRDTRGDKTPIGNFEVDKDNKVYEQTGAVKLTNHNDGNVNVDGKIVYATCSCGANASGQNLIDCFEAKFGQVLSLADILKIFRGTTQIFSMKINDITYNGWVEKKPDDKTNADKLYETLIMEFRTGQTFRQWEANQNDNNPENDNVILREETYQTYSPYWYFYNQDGKNWWAEAIKGDAGQVYPVINRNAEKDYSQAEKLDTNVTKKWSSSEEEYYRGEEGAYNHFNGIANGKHYDTVPPQMLDADGHGKDYISGFKGLDVDIYTIGFALATENLIEKETAQGVLKSIASIGADREPLYWDATNKSTMDEAFAAIMEKATATVSEAYYIDTMGDFFNLNLSDSPSASSNKYGTITIKSYTLDKDGNRGSGNVVEKLTINSATNVISTEMTGNIFNSETGLIVGKYVVYNTKSTAYDYNGTEIPGESFYWIIGSIPNATEMVLTYPVVSDQSKLPNEKLAYSTNNSAILHYHDAYSNHAHKETISPKATCYAEAEAYYQFYLVNSLGDPITAQGQKVDSPADAVKIGSSVRVIVAASGSFVDDVDKTDPETAVYKITPSYSTVDYALYETDPSFTINSARKVQSHDVVMAGGTTKCVNPTTGMDNEALKANVVYVALVKKAANPDTVVVDYGLPVDIDLIHNDYLSGGTNTIYGYVKPNGLGQNVSMASSQTTAPDKTQTFTDNWAKVETVTFTETVDEVEIETDKSRWTGQAMNLSNYYQYGYWVAHKIDSNTTYYYGNTVTVIPATSIYYEDSFVTFVKNEDRNSGDGKTALSDTTFTWAEWQPVGTAADVGSTQNQDRPGSQGEKIDHDKVYGNDDAYASTTTYSGTAQKVTVTPKQPARAYFTFTGTGFDVISRTDIHTGGITVAVYDLEVFNTQGKFDDPSTQTTYEYNKETGQYDWNWNIEGADTVTNKVVNTYYDAGDGIYQVPVIKFDNLAYDTYIVEILVAYDEWFDVGQYDGAEKADFYLDSIRIYNPAGIADSTNGFSGVIRDAYLQDGEGWPRYQELRNMILDPHVTFGKDETGKLCFQNGNASYTDVTGILFMKGETAVTDYTPYAYWGPNNEVYLETSDKVFFKLNEQKYVEQNFTNLTAFGGTVAKIQIGLRGMGGTSKVELYNGTTLFDEFTVSANDQYFDITGLKNANVMIQVTGANPVSITNVKVTHTEKPSGYDDQFTKNKPSTRAAVSTTTGNLADMKSLFTISADMASAMLDELNANQTAPAKLTPKYASLSFKDLIHTNIYFDADRYSGISTEDLGMAVFTSNDVGGTVDTASYVVNGATLVDGMYKVSTKGIPAKNLGDTIYFKVFAREADGSYTYSNILAYSPVEYANFLITSGSDMDKALAAAMLNYGAEAQKYFGYNTENLMNAAVTDEAQALLNVYSIDDLDALAPVDESKAGAFTANGGFNEKYPTVSFKGAFGINFYVKPSEAVDGNVTFYYWTQETYSSAAQLTADNADGVAVMDESNGLYSGTVDGIFAKDLDDTVYAAAVYQADGVTYCTGILPYSVAEYARSFANTADDFAPFANATGIYGSVAKAYFGN